MAKHFSDKYISTVLTAEQAAAARPHVGTKATVATAGAGKTTKMAKSIVMKLYGDEGADVERDEDILATTFTTASARDLRKKIDSMAGRKTRVRVGTLHAFCFDLLKKHHAIIDFPKGVQNIKESEKRSRLQGILFALCATSGLNPSRFSVADLILAGNVYDVKSVSSDEADLGRLAGWRCPKILLDAYASYRNYQKIGGFVDYDTMLVYTHDILARIKSRDDASSRGVFLPRHVYVDEAQDLSAVQWAIVSQLARLSISITVIGDDDQAIYGWRGATVHRFKAFYDQALIRCMLTSNRRCPPGIVSIGEGIVAGITPERRIIKELRSGKPSNECHVYGIMSHDRSAVVTRAVDFIKQSILDGRLRPRDVAIIYRNTTHIVDEYAQALTRAELPYKTLGGKDPLDSDDMRLFRYTLAVGSGGPWGEVEESRGHWLGLIESVGVTPDAAEKIVGQAVALGGRGDHYARSIEASRIGGGSRNSLLALVDAMRSTRTGQRKVLVGDLARLEVVRDSIKGTIERMAENYGRQLAKGGRMTPSDVAESRRQFTESKTHWTFKFIDDARFLTTDDLERKMSGFQDDTEPGDQQDDDTVTLATAHSCKGLEWPMVFIIDPMADAWPSKSAFKNLKSKHNNIRQDILDEERRLLYVAVTRSKKAVFFVMSSVPAGLSAVSKRELSPLLGFDVFQKLQDVYDGAAEDGAVAFTRVSL